jgi:hypothetical protein
MEITNTKARLILYTDSASKPAWAVWLPKHLFPVCPKVECVGYGKDDHGHFDYSGPDLEKAISLIREWWKGQKGD